MQRIWTRISTVMASFFVYFVRSIRPHLLMFSSRRPSATRRRRRLQATRGLGLLDGDFQVGLGRDLIAPPSAVATVLSRLPLRTKAAAALRERSTRLA